MKLMSSLEKDLELKLRTMRYLWHLGYFVRRNVDLVEYGYARARRVYTDIDVLGLKLDENFHSHFKTCDCKSGVRVKTAERLFWLSGVMDYFAAKEGIFIRNHMMEAKYVELSKRLNITPISSSQLSDLEKTYKVSERFYGPFCQEQETIDDIFSELKKHERFCHDYILKRYWKDTPQQQIVTLMSSCRRLKDIKGMEDYKQSFVLAYTLSCLALSILRFSKPILMIPDMQKEEAIKYELLGGRESFAERRELLEAFYDFMVKEIKERYKERYPLTKTDFLANLIPEYSKYFIDLVVRFCKNPVSAIAVPRLMDLFAFEVVVNYRKVSLEDLMPTANGYNGKLSLKPFKDFLVYAARSDLTTDILQEASKEYIESLESSIESD